ncbi:PrsW family intramembrane metalloprotease [Kribbella sp. CA-247076]|uniref:PrsW family intramembrane metalloprotease n=1 Tax=Kribbella sp. CA-247076 TaxID=3239941 RepID=UPI003D8F91DB
MFTMPPVTPSITAGPLEAAGPVSRLRRYAWLLVLVTGAALFAAVERTMVATNNPNYVPTAILLGAAVIPVAFLAFVNGRPMPYTVPLGMVVGAAFFGGVVGTVVAGWLEYDTVRHLDALPVLGIGLAEEASKLIAPLVLLPVLRNRTRADGLLLGVACGAGFAALETMGYAFVTLVGTGGKVSATVDLLVLRGALSPACHMAWTGIAAAALYAAAASGWKARRVLHFALAFVAAVVLHALWDASSALPVHAVLALSSLGLLWLTARRVGVAVPKGERS